MSRIKKLLFSDDRPINPARFPFFYGWVIVVVSAIGVVASVPGQTVGVSFFSEAIIGATRLSRVSVSHAYMVGTVLSGLTLPRVGRLVDRVGARASGMGAALVLSAVVFGLSHLGRPVGWSDAAMLLLLVALFYLLRLSGQGTLTLVSRTMVGRWFERRRGLAAGLRAPFVSLAFGASPTLFRAWIGRAGWRGAWLEMAIVIGFGMTLIAYLFYRDRPEDVGLEVDGGPPPVPAAKSSRRPPETGRDYERDEALKTVAFWAVAFALAVQALVVTGFTFHIEDIGRAAGLDSQGAAHFFLPLAVVAVSVSIIGGFVADAVPVRVLLIALLFGQAVGLYAAADLGERYWLAVAGFGLSGGLFSTTATVAFPRFFGRTHLGAISGVEMMCLVLASAVGPSLMAGSRAYWGAYWPALYGAIGLSAAALALVLLYRHPARLDGKKGDR